MAKKENTTATADNHPETDLMNLEIFRENWDKMDIPKGFEFLPSDNISKGSFVLEPLYKGYGQTIGNSLRRVLLSSLVGTAVTAVKIEGVEHEFQAINGVREDVLQIILNLKGLKLKPLVNGPYEASIKVKGPKTVTGADIITKEKLEIINPDHLICHIDQEVELEMTLFIRVARGYRTSEENFREDLPVGTIYLDSNHSPILAVDYQIESTRVRQKTDYERLIFNISTNGTISPRDTLAYAAKILTNYYSIFINFEDRLPEPEKKIAPQVNTSPHLKKNISELELSIRSINCLQNAKIETISQLVQKTEAEMLKTKNFGKKSMQEIKNILASMGLTLGMTISEIDLSNSQESENSQKDAT